MNEPSASEWSFPPSSTQPEVRPLERELFGTLNWVAIAVVVILAGSVRAFWEAAMVADARALFAKNEALGKFTLMLTIRLLAGCGLFWTAWRAVPWLRAVWRLRTDAGPAPVEEAFRRLRRLWVPLCFCAASCFFMSVGSIPEQISRAGRHAANLEYLSTSFKTSYAESRARSEKAAAESEAEKRRAERVKHLEEQYYREKAARDAPEKK